jgi:hypothetical protein
LDDNNGGEKRIYGCRGKKFYMRINHQKQTNNTKQTRLNNIIRVVEKKNNNELSQKMGFSWKVIRTRPQVWDN